MQILYFLIIGLIAGWLAGKIIKGKGFGAVGDIVIGCVGACLGGFLFGLLGLTAAGLIGDLVCATVGAIALIYLVRFLQRAV